VSTLSTHVLDATTGVPAAGVEVRLYAAADNGQDDLLARVATDADGRVSRIADPPLTPGRYRLVFGTGDYFARQGTATFYPEVSITFQVGGPGAGQHYHVPLLLSPFAYSTYRGS
jgi:5-hydroxyisourate hydrolase